MAKFKDKKSVALIIITAIFLVLGIACLIIGAYSTILSWLTKCGIAFLVLASPILVFVIAKIINNKIKEM